jgi:hypothetical protein
MKHYVITITTNHPDELSALNKHQELINGTSFMYDVAAEDFVHAIVQLPAKLPEDSIVKLERTYST